jgi:hypothetical protein
MSTKVDLTGARCTFNGTPLGRVNRRLGHPPFVAVLAGGWAPLYNLVGVVKRHVECLRSACPLRGC